MYLYVYMKKEAIKSCKPQGDARRTDPARMSLSYLDPGTKLGASVDHGSTYEYDLLNRMTAAVEPLVAVRLDRTPFTWSA
jgi:hypothetical protein